MVYYGDQSSCYRGNWHAGLPWGRGIRQWPSGNFYEGQWAQGVPSGNGVKTWCEENIHYRGEFEAGQPVSTIFCTSVRLNLWHKHGIWFLQHGYGLLLWIIRQPSNTDVTNRKYLYGNFQRGAVNGFGIFMDFTGTKYIGYWKEGRKHGNVCGESCSV